MTITPVVFRCVLCNAPMGKCDCRVKCNDCDWLKERGKSCKNWVHQHPYAVLSEKDHYFKIGENFKIRKTYGTKRGIFAALQSGNIFLFRKDANAAVQEAQAAGITMAEWFKRRLSTEPLDASRAEELRL